MDNKIGNQRNTQNLKVGQASDSNVTTNANPSQGAQKQFANESLSGLQRRPTSPSVKNESKNIGQSMFDLVNQSDQKLNSMTQYFEDYNAKMQQVLDSNKSRTEKRFESMKRIN